MEVVDLRTLRPLDAEVVLKSVKKTNRVIIVEECWRTCGVGSEIAAIVSDEAFDYLDAPVKTISFAEIPIPCCPALENHALPRVDLIKKTSLELF